MKPAAEQLRERLAHVALTAPRIPLINNVDATVQGEPEAIRDALYRQAFGAVRWVEVVQALRTRGIERFVECGPGKVLTGLAQRIAPQAQSLSLFDPASRAATEAALVSPWPQA